jgi:hypothetical protein
MAARYWRIVGVETYGKNADLSLSEVALFDGATLLTGTLTSTVTPAAGAIANLQDATPTTCRFNGGEVYLPGFGLYWDFGADKDVSEIRLTGPSKQEFVYSYSLQWSADGLAWVERTAPKGVVWLGADNYSSFSIGSGDPDYPSVELLLSCDDPNVLVDSSSSPKTITPVGSPVASTTQVKFGTKSLYLDGASSLTVSGHPADILHGVFTLEVWIYSTVVSGADQAVFDSRNGAGACLSIQLNSGSAWIVEPYYDNLIALGTLPTGQWNHIATARDANGLMYGFLNGELKGTRSRATLFNATAVKVGASQHGAFTGYIDGLRITKGIARYTGAFAAPTSAFPTSAGTFTGDPHFSSVIAALHFDGPPTTFTDSSPLASTWTPAGGAVISTTDSKFGGTSLYLDGNGDYLTTPGVAAFLLGTGDFTIEAWIKTSQQSFVLLDYWTSGPAGAWQVYVLNGKISFWVGSGVAKAGVITISTGTWTHIAICRSSGMLDYYVDGVKDGSSVAFATNLNNTLANLAIGAQVTSRSVGLDYTGYIDDLRVTKGVARYTGAFTPPTSAFLTAGSSGADTNFSSVSLLLHGNGQNFATFIEDSSGTPKVLTNNGVTLSTDQSKFGGSSIFFNPVNNYGQWVKLSYSPVTDFEFPGDFTVETWLYPLSFGANWGSFIASTGNQSSNLYGWHLLYGQAAMGNLIRMDTGIGAVNSNAPPALNAWTHIAVVRSGTSLKMFVNGVQQTETATCSGTVPATQFKMGSSGNDAGTTGIAGYIEDFRVTKGVARYTADFTPPTVQLPTATAAPLANYTATYRTVTSAPPAPLNITNYAPSGAVAMVAASLLPTFDLEGFGAYQVVGTVKESSTPANVPLSRRVRLIKELDGRLLKEMWSNPTTGAYAFTNIRGDLAYTVVTYDHLHNYRAVIADNLTAERMP